MIKNYIFDFGNVLARFDPYMISKVHIEDEKIAKTVSEIVFDRFYFNRLDAGTLDDDAMKDELSARLDKSLYEYVDKVFGNWHLSMPPIEGMQALVRDVKQSGARVYLLSNISRGFARNYKDCEWINELFSLFDGLVFSGVVGMTKPNLDIFEYILDKYSLKADECLFVDDHLPNIQSANAVGINTYHFDGDAQKLRQHIGL